jgi:hypothetical protein
LTKASTSKLKSAVESSVNFTLRSNDTSARPEGLLSSPFCCQKKGF